MNKKDAKTEPKPAERYFEGVGRRKTAVARVWVRKGRGEVAINSKNLEAYFPMKQLRERALAPLENLKLAEKFNVSVKVAGGGVSAQAEAVRHGLARALVEFNPEFKHRMRALGFMTRDSRMVERKKYGLKKARRAPQWQKR